MPLENVNVADEPRILCIIRDLVDPHASSVKHTLNVTGSTSIQILLIDVAKKFGYMIGTIGVHLEKQEGSDMLEIALEQHTDGFLVDMINPNQKRHNLTICEIEGVTPKKMPPPPPPPPSKLSTEESSTTLYSSDFFSNNTTLEPRHSSVTVPSASSSSSYTASEFTYASALIKSDTGFVGLVNQAMTCYLNSLLQTLYMTPEFRNAIYKYHFDSDKGVKNIPYQLQRLFLLLQTSHKRAVETTDLTKSFGWDSSEVWQQHDVQELCRVMFEALETTWKGTDQENLINHLYQGKMKDYVKCLECKQESAREDTFLDIPLVIRPFGSTVAYKSVMEALQAFVSPETLEGRDQYFCEKCNKKCDAHKGLRFLEFPYLLTLQMKRFDFDYTTMHRIKLNDRMTFPEILNLNHLVEDPASTDLNCPPDNTPVCSSVNDLLSNSNHLDDDEGIEVEGSPSTLSCNEDSSPSCEAMANDKNILEPKGPYVYELFSIMIHSGSAAGGHYYAYIKNLSDGQWYSFNDQHVSQITYDDIRKTYGGSMSTRGYYSSSYASSANAYMLMYRKKDKDRNADFIETGDLPEHVKEELRRLNDKEEQDRKQKEIDKSTCKIKLFCNHPSQKKKLEQKLEIHKDKTLKEATEIAYKMFSLEDVVEADCCRIVKYDEFQDSLECSFENEEETVMEKLLGGVKQSYSFDLLLETKKPDQKFQEYKPGGVTVKVYVVDMSKDVIVEPPSSVRAYLVQTVEEFKTLTSQVLNLPIDKSRFVLEKFHNDLKLLHTPNKTLKSEGFFKTNKVYVEINGNEMDQEGLFEKSQFYSVLDRHQNTIHVQINLPSLGEVADYKKQMFIRDQSPTGQDSAVESGVNSGDNSEDNGVGLCNHRRCSLEADEGIGERTEQCLGADMQSLSLHSQLSRSDPALYFGQPSGAGLTQGEVLSSLQDRGSRSSLECQGSGSRSTESTSNSADLNVDNSICDVTSESPNEDPPGTDIDWKSLLANKDNKDNKSLVEDDQYLDIVDCKNGMPLEGQFVPEGSGEPVEHSCYSSPLPRADLSGIEVSAGEPATATGWDTDSSKIATSCDELAVEFPRGNRRYFHAELVEDGDQRNLNVHVDKRITLGAFKQELEPFVQVSSDNFKVYRVYCNNQEFESIRLGETLAFLEDGRINIKLGRPLKNGEYRVKVFQLLVNELEPSKFLLDTIFARGMTILDSKKQVLSELKIEHNMDVPLDRCRLRKKTWKNPGTIYIDSQKYEEEIPIYPNWEVFLEILIDPEQVTSTAHLAVYVRQWKPSIMELGPFQEVVISQQTVEELKSKISELSGINEDDIEIAKGRGTFPYDVSLLEIHVDLDWNPSVSALSMWPLYICDDGCLVYYRDKHEKPMVLSEEKRKEFEAKENARLSKTSQRVSYSPRKERALKIYTEDSQPSNTNNSTTATTSTTTEGLPDLD